MWETSPRSLAEWEVLMHGVSLSWQHAHVYAKKRTKTLSVWTPRLLRVSVAVQSWRGRCRGRAVLLYRKRFVPLQELNTICVSQYSYWQALRTMDSQSQFPDVTGNEIFGFAALPVKSNFPLPIYIIFNKGETPSWDQDPGSMLAWNMGALEAICVQQHFIEQTKTRSLYYTRFECCIRGHTWSKAEASVV